MFINKYWVDRTLHLFDIFEGFLYKDVTNERNTFEKFKKGTFGEDSFKVETPEQIIEVVKSRMFYSENLRIHKGYFPENAGNIEDTFCFVNLDMDLYQLQLEGLKFF